MSGMESFVVRGMYEDADSFEWPRFVVLGKQAGTLAGRMIEYAQSISPTDCRPVPAAIELRPFDLDAWLVLQEKAPWLGDIFVAISGLLSAYSTPNWTRIPPQTGQ